MPHEEYGTPRFNFYDEMVRSNYYSHFQKHPLLLYDDAHIHGCTSDIHLSHLKTHGFYCSTLGAFVVGGTSSKTRVNRVMIGEKFCFQPHTLLHYDYTDLHGCTYDVHLSHLETHDFPYSLPSLFYVGGTSSHT